MEQNYMNVELPQPKNPKKKIWLTVIGDIVFVIVLAIMIFYAIFNFTFEYHPVEGYSMSPTLNLNSSSEDSVYLMKSKEYKRGDIIVAKHSNVLVIKRLIATGGEKINISFEHGKCVIYIIKPNENEPIKYDYSFIGGIGYAGTYDDFIGYTQENSTDVENIDGKFYLTIPYGYVFYLGDNMQAGESEDCADYGPVNQELLVGKVRFVIHERKHYVKQIIEQIIKKPDYI